MRNFLAYKNNNSVVILIHYKQEVIQKECKSSE